MVLLLVVFDDEGLWFLDEVVFLKLGCRWGASSAELGTLAEKASHYIGVASLLFGNKSTLLLSSTARTGEMLLEYARIVARRGTQILTLRMIETEPPVLVNLRGSVVLQLACAGGYHPVTARWSPLIWRRSVTMTGRILMRAGVRLSALGRRRAGGIHDCVCIWMNICRANVHHIFPETPRASTASE